MYILNVDEGCLIVPIERYHFALHPKKQENVGFSKKPGSTF